MARTGTFYLLDDFFLKFGDRYMEENGLSPVMMKGKVGVFIGPDHFDPNDVFEESMGDLFD